MTEEQLAAMLDELEAHTAWLRTEGPILLRRARAGGARDGFPTRSMGGGSPTTLLDDEGHPMPPRSDPTGELVVDLVDAERAGKPSPDPIRDAARTVSQGVEKARGELRAAEKALRATQRPATDDGVTGCESCARVHDHEGRPLFSPVHRESARLCRWCYDFDALEGQWPTATLVRARMLDGKRITASMVAEALGKRTTQRRTA